MRLSFPLLALLVSACVDTSGAWNLNAARATFDAVPSLTQSEYAAAIAAQPLTYAAPPPRSPPVLDVPTIVDPDPIDEPAIAQTSPALGSGEPIAAFPVSSGCEALPANLSSETLIVAAFRDALPDADLIFEVRVKQSTLARCIEERGSKPKFETRLDQSSLDASVELQIFT